MNIKNNGNITEGNIGLILIKTTLPMILSVVSMMMFNLVDTYFAGQLGKLELAALSLTFPVVLIIGSIAHGLGIGVSALISRKYGEGNLDTLKRLMTDSLSIGLIIVGIFIPVGLLTTEPVFKTLGATTETPPLVKQYMTICYTGVIFVVIPMIGNSAFRGLGDTKTPSLNALKNPFKASLLTIIEMFVLCIPLSMMGSYFLA